MSTSISPRRSSRTVIHAGPAAVDPATVGRLLIAVLVGLELQKALEPDFDVAACGRLLPLWTETLTDE